MEVEAVRRSGTWSEVVLVQEEREVFGRVLFQALLKKARSSLPGLELLFCSTRCIVCLEGVIQTGLGSLLFG